MQFIARALRPLHGPRPAWALVPESLCPSSWLALQLGTHQHCLAFAKGVARGSFVASKFKLGKRKVCCCTSAAFLRTGHSRETHVSVDPLQRSQYLQRSHRGQLEEGSVINDSQRVMAEDPEKQESSVRAVGKAVCCVCRQRGDGLAGFKEALQEMSRAGERPFPAARSCCSPADIHRCNQDFPEGKAALAY